MIKTEVSNNNDDDDDDLQTQRSTRKRVTQYAIRRRKGLKHVCMSVCVCGKTWKNGGCVSVGIECNFHTLCNNKQKGDVQRDLWQLALPHRHTHTRAHEIIIKQHSHN